MQDITELGLKHRASGSLVSAAVAVPPVKERTGGSPGKDRTGGIALAILIDRLLDVLGRQAPETEPADTAEFQSKMQELRRRFGDTIGGQETHALADLCVRTCDTYLKGARQYQAERQTEMGEVVALLRSAAAALLGDSAQYHARILTASDTLVALTGLDDIRELKQRLTTEVGALRTVVADRQKREEAAYAELSTRVESLQVRLDRAEEEAGVDAVTRVSNRRTFDKTLTRMIATAKRGNAPLTLAMIDVDKFKSINDQHGHPIGDRVLVCVADLLSKSVRRTDFVARYGGEEFVALLADAPVKHVEARLTALVKEIAATKFEYDVEGQHRSVRFTVSCGAAEMTSSDTDADLVRRADEALYEAKRKGRNRLVTKRRSLLNNLLSR